MPLQLNILLDFIESMYIGRVLLILLQFVKKRITVKIARNELDLINFKIPFVCQCIILLQPRLLDELTKQLIVIHLQIPILLIGILPHNGVLVRFAPGCRGIANWLLPELISLISIGCVLVFELFHWRALLYGGFGVDVVDLDVGRVVGNGFVLTEW